MDFREDEGLESYGRAIFVDCRASVCDYDDLCIRCLELKQGKKCREHNSIFWYFDEEKVELRTIKEKVSLPSLGVNPNTITFSGFSSGSYMAS